jgi:hypothetical protein
LNIYQNNLQPVATVIYTVASIAGWLFEVVTLYSATTSNYLVVANMLIPSPSPTWIDTFDVVSIDCFA